MSGYAVDTIALEVPIEVLAGVNDRLGDGVNVNDAAYHALFPYIGSSPDGRNRRHVDPGEAGRGPRPVANPS